MRKVLWIGRFLGHGGFATSTRRYARALSEYVEHLSIGSLEVLPPEHEFYTRSRQPIDDSEFKVVNHLPITDPEAHGYFSVCEYDRIPERWAECLNQSRVIMTQSRFCKEIFANSVEDKSKIKVIPYILGEKYIHFSPIGEKIRIFPPERFVFGSVFEWVPRKVPEKMIAAFLYEFEPGELVNLVLRTKLPPEGTLKQDLGTSYPLFLQAVKAGRISVVESPIPDLLPFYRGINAYVMPSAGEGWGQPLSEAMACGLPTIGSNHSGNLDFMSPINSYLVDVGPWSEVNPRSPENFHWKLPRVESIQAAMRQVYEDSHSGRIEAKIKEAVKIRELFTPEKIGPLLFAAIRKFL